MIIYVGKESKGFELLDPTTEKKDTLRMCVCHIQMQTGNAEALMQWDLEVEAFEGLDEVVRWDLILRSVFLTTRGRTAACFLSAIGKHKKVTPGHQKEKVLWEPNCQALS